jgi:hypothetical protein
LNFDSLFQYCPHLLKNCRDEERELSIQRHDAAISAQREQSDREAWDNHEWEAQNQPPHQQAIIVASSDDDSEGTGSS